MKDLISVIVPVYHVAEYLPQCVDSVLSQDHRALEVILIDDGSRDGSGQICDQYALQDSRVRVIHQENAGAGAAKNAGLRAATGEYLSFVDSDDFLEPRVYGYMLQVLKDARADAAVFSFRDLYRTGGRDYSGFSGREILTGEEYLLRFPTDWTCALLWNKLYRRELYDGVFFPEGRKIDDEFFTYQGFFHAGRVVCDDRIIYNYRRRASGVMSLPQTRAQRMIDRIEAMVQRRELMNRRLPHLRRDVDIAYLDALGYMADYGDNSPESLQFLKQLLRSYLGQRGNTLPPRRLWRPLLRLGLSKTETLLAQCAQNQEEVSVQDYFP